MVSRRLHRREPPASPGSLAGLPPLLARVYAARGIQVPADLERSLAALHPPSTLQGLGAATARIADALCAGEPILVIGDYDADGATSTALLLLGLRALGCTTCDFLVPNRFEFGYGLTPGIVGVAAARAPRLIVTVDNGISSIAGVAEARRHGIDVVVTDHHLAGDELPAAIAILNPNQPGCAFPSKHLAGVGVVFYLLGALRAELRARGWLQRSGIAEPRLADLLDLVALGTVADMVSLDRNNRILVHQGLLRLRSGRGRPGVRALFEVAGRDPRRASSADLGFVAGPRLNAAGRLEDMSLGIRCLLEEDPLRAREMAAELDRLNRERRAIEAGMQREALRLLHDDTAAGEEMPWGLTLFHPEWHQGVVGLVASRLKERHHRPVIAFAPGNDSELRGSARSVAGFHVRDALVAIDAREPGLILRFGGHAMAAGLSLRPEDLPRFGAAFDTAVRAALTPAALEGVIESDGALAAGEFSIEIAEMLQDGGPWGQHFPEPLFDGVFVLHAQRIVGERHLKLRVSPVAEPALLLDAIAFGVDLQRWPDDAVVRARLAYRLDINEYRGSRALQLVVEQIEACG